MNIGNYNFVKTCCCSPEQYDVFDKNGNQVAYVRLRWGCLYAQYPDVGGVDIYETSIGDGWTGCFESEQQRQSCLSQIAEQIDKYVGYTCKDCDDCEGVDEVIFCRHPFSPYCDQCVTGNRVCHCFNVYEPEDNEEE